MRPRRAPQDPSRAAAPRSPHRAGVRRLSDRSPSPRPHPSRHRGARRHDGPAGHRDAHPARGVLRHRARLRHAPGHRQGRQAGTRAGADPRRPIGPHALRRTVGTVGLNQGIPLRDVQRLLRHVRPETTLGSYDITGDALERHASHQIAGFLAGWAS
ncbi:tyrosine-type recombinase/integrase [Geodermatophilus chilensis]|uniref:tyrosine-type recombinase/integrase n=1 Tax=Geodermatophilus chilensis TaxID=2035835 RepID=UPI0012FFD993|nr:tyrosine-type recombinase/integrase [Geodermatophilus chilensis]